MAELIREVDNWKINYYQVYPYEEQTSENELIKKGGDILGIIVDNKTEMPEEEIKNVSKKIQNIVLIYAQRSEKTNIDYKVNLFFNGMKANIFVYSIIALLKFLYDNSLIRSTIKIEINDTIIKGSSRPDDKANFYIKMEPPNILELNYPLFDILNSISIRAEDLSTKHNIYELHTPLIKTAPLPIISPKALDNARYMTSYLVGLKNRFRTGNNFPSYHIYYFQEDKNTIRSRYFHTTTIIMEHKASPLSASMLHYFLMKIDKEFRYEELTHYQGKNPNNLSRIITKIETTDTKHFKLLAGGKCYSV
ncbi:MAG: hypothetical protein ACOCV8_03100 [Spirochaetota bacterium]